MGRKGPNQHSHRLAFEHIKRSSFNKHLKNGTYYLGKYLFSREPVLTAKVKEISILDLALILDKDRVKHNKNKPTNSLSKSVLLVDENNSNNIESFSSLGKCVEYLRNKGLPATQVTLVKRINSGEAYYGYKCKYMSNKYFRNGVHIKNLTICWNSQVSIGTFNSDNLIGYAQSAGSRTHILWIGPSETKS